MIHLRAADRLDAGALAELRAASLTEQGLLTPEHTGPFVGRAAQEIGAFLRSDRIAAWIACDDLSVIASSCVIFYDRLPYPDGSRHAELCGVYVRPAYRRRGFATELVRETLAAARAGGARKTFLRPAPETQALYARCGFVATDLMLFAGAPQGAASEPLLAALPAR